MDKLFISDSFVSIFVLYPAPIGNVNSDESIWSKSEQKDQTMLNILLWISFSNFSINLNANDTFVYRKD